MAVIAEQAARKAKNKPRQNKSEKKNHSWGFTELVQSVAS